MNQLLKTVASVVLATVTLSISTARAQDCSTLTNPVIVSGSTAIKTVVQNMAPFLISATGSDQLTIVYKSSGSCSGVTQLAADTTPTGACTAAACVTGTANYWDTAGVMQTCTLPAAGAHIDLILSDVYATSCSGADVHLFQDTPTVAIPFAFIVPHASAQTAIDVREAYYVYGLGMAGMVTPWTNESFIFRRNAGSGTQVTIARNIHLPEGSLLGIDTGSNANMVTMVAGASDAESTIGFGSLDAVDQHRDTLTILAYRHWDQTHYYWPDSRHDTFDKANVRDGHYPLWGYEHADVLLNAPGGTPVSARGAQLAAVLAGTRPLPGASNITLLATQAGVVPTCAMGVSRTTDGGDFSVYTPPESCACYFDAHVPMGHSSCMTCSTSCATGVCRNGFCEAR